MVAGVLSAQRYVTASKVPEPDVSLSRNSDKQPDVVSCLVPGSDSLDLDIKVLEVRIKVQRRLVCMC